MKSQDIVQSIKKKYPKSGIVQEISLADKYAHQAYLSALPDNIKRYYEGRNIIDPDHVTDPQYDMNNMKFMRRIDLLMLDQRQWTALEVKVSRADFFRDTYEKRKVWMEHSHRFIYVTPPNLVTKDEIPERCGLWEFHPDKQWNNIQIVKRATVNKNIVPFPDDFIARVFYRLSQAESRLRRQK